MYVILFYFIEKSLKDYTTDEVAGYFEQIKMEKYVECVIDGGISGNFISSATLAALDDDAGIDNHLDCLKISMHISQLKNGKSEALTHEAISRFLRKYNLEKYKPAFEQQDYDDISVLNSSRIIVYYRKYLGEDYDHNQSKKDLAIQIEKDPEISKDIEQKIMDNDISLQMLKEGGVKLLSDIGIAKYKARQLMRRLFGHN